MNFKKNQDNTAGLATRIIHDQAYTDPWGSPDIPLYASTTFRFARTADLLEVVEGRKVGALYTRYGLNPSILALEHTLAQLETAEGALAFSSGIAALSAAFLSTGQGGVVCLGEMYGGTQTLLEKSLSPLGVPVIQLPFWNEAELVQVLRPGQWVFFETPSNPTLSIIDIAAVVDLAHRAGAKVLIDSTFATPVNQNPLALGVDLVVHSATKYLGGHSDITAGAVMGSMELLKPLAVWRQNLGSILAPVTASMLVRSLKTLIVRVERQNATAAALADSLQKNPQVQRVLYPGLPEHPGHAIARRQMRGFGGMLTLELPGGQQSASAVADQLRLFLLAPSLGGVESLVTQPCLTSHRELSAAERQRRGISEGMLRLSVGLEAVEDLLADLQQALEVVYSV